MTRDHRALRVLLRAAAAGLLAASIAAPASAYVVVMNDNQVYEVPSRPEIRDQMVFFVLDGRPVSLRVYDINIAKTNELNYMLDTGASLSQVSQQVRAMTSATPTDQQSACCFISFSKNIRRFSDNFFESAKPITGAR